MASSYPKLNNAISNLACLLKRLVDEGMSGRASNLNILSKREVTRCTYSSGWNKWVNWCAELNRDLVRCDVNWILDFVAFFV